MPNWRTMRTSSASANAGAENASASIAENPAHRILRNPRAMLPFMSLLRLAVETPVVVRFRSSGSAAEPGLAPCTKRFHALVALAARQCEREELVLVIDAAREIEVRTAQHRVAREHQRDRSLGLPATADVHRVVHQLAGGHHAIDETDAPRLGGVDRVAEGDEFHGAAEADEPGEP